MFLLINNLALNYPVFDFQNINVKMSIIVNERCQILLMKAVKYCLNKIANK